MITVRMERYVIGQDFNTNDWYIYDNKNHQVVCRFDREEDAIEWLRGE